jgi:hypothetical protein
MKHVLLIASLLVVASEVLAQGFDWQYSIRYPTASPTRFGGISAEAGVAMHQGSLPYLEQDIAVPCCTYEQGSGIPLSVGVAYEQWASASIAIYGTAGYRFMSASMSAQPSESEPFADGRVLVTQYTYDARLHYADVVAGLRFRLGRSNASIGTALRMSLLLGTSATHRHEVLSPSDYTFTTNPPSRSVEIPVVGVPSATRVLLTPVVTFGYDVSIANGLYLSPLLSVGLPLMNTAHGVVWKTSDAAIALRLFRAL